MYLKKKYIRCFQKMLASYKSLSTAFLLSVCVLGLGSTSYALPTWNGEVGESSFQLLKLNLSPRTAALNGSGVSYSTSILEATDLNPAAAYSARSGISLGQAYPFEQFEAKIPHVSTLFSVGPGKLFFSGRFLGFQDIRGFSEDDQNTTNYGAHTLKVQTGYAIEWHQVHFGIGLSYALNNIENHSFQTVIVDLGAQYTWKYGLHIGGAVTNADLWTSQASRGGTVYPPTTIQGGLGYARTWRKHFKGVLLLDVRKRNDEKVTIPMGLELVWRELLTGRLGYVLGNSHQELGLSFGGEVSWSGYRFEYAMATHKSLGPAHYITLSIEY